MPGEACVQRVNSPFASPAGSMICFPRSSRLVFIVPVSIPNVALSVRSFSSIAQASWVSPLDLFQTELQHHPGQVGVAYVLSGIREGFRIFYFSFSFESSMVNLKSASSNMHSSFENPLVTRTCRPKFSLAGWPDPFQPLLFLLYISAVLGSFPRTINHVNGVSSSTVPLPLGTG